MTPDSLLFAPLTLNRLTLPNRVVVTAMVTRLCGEDGFVNQAILDRYTRFAKGEAGLIVVEATAVHRAKSGPLLRLCDDEFIPGQRELVERVHAAGPSKIAVQIIHFLKIARSGWRQTLDMLSGEELSSIVRDYGEAAARARESQFDPDQLITSIDRMMSYAPDSMYLMHYSRVTGTPRLAEMLKSQIREFVRIARDCEASPDAHNAIRAAMLALWLKLLQQQGSTVAADDVAKVLESDLELNAQGLLIWLARQRRSNSSDSIPGGR